MRDLIERHDAFGAAMMADLTGRAGRAGPAEPVGGQDGGPATSVWSGGGNGRQRASDAIQVEDTHTHTILTAEAHDPMGAYISFIDDEGDVALHGVCAIYAAAQRVMAVAGPLPLAATEPWVEGDEEYRGRLVRAASNKLEHWTDPADVALARSHHLDGYGDLLANSSDDLGLPRASLVRGSDRIADLDRVEVLVSVETDRGTSVPAGAYGTVVGIWCGGAAYEIEFWNGVDEYGYSLATVSTEHVRLVPVEV